MEYPVPRNFYVIPTHRRYATDVAGNIYSLESGRFLEVDRPEMVLKGKVWIDGGWISIDTLLMDTFVGHLDLPITSTVPVPKRAGALTYRFTSVNKWSNDEWLIDGYRFRVIPGFSMYMISDNGVVIRRSDLHCMHCKYTANHYQTVALIPDGEGLLLPKKLMVNRLVYSIFVGPIPDGHVVDHKDSNTLNNYYTNLQAITQAENVNRSFEMGHRQDVNYFSDEVVHEICRRMSLGENMIDIAHGMHIPPESRPSLYALIGGLYRGSNRQSIAKQYDFSNFRPYRSGFKVPTEIQEKIVASAAEGYNMTRLAAMYPSIDSQVIRRIVQSAGIPLNRKDLTYAEADEIATYLKTHTTKEAMEKYNVGAAVLSHIASGRFFETRGRGYTVPSNELKFKRLSQEEKDAILQELKEGATNTYLAQKYGVSNAAISKIKRFNGLLSKHPYLTDEQRQEVIQLLKDGLSPKEIAPKYGVTPQSIHVIRQKHLTNPNASKNEPHRLTYDEKVNILRMLKDSVPVGQIAKENNVYNSTVYDMNMQLVKPISSSRSYNDPLTDDEKVVAIKMLRKGYHVTDIAHHINAPTHVIEDVLIAAGELKVD